MISNNLGGGIVVATVDLDRLVVPSQCRQLNPWPLSPSATPRIMMRKALFFGSHGTDYEYFIAPIKG
ncbi:hypothetical protein SynROS8604_01953 [Synechococcus sp. ROS8604]|nr:hypothetical protein SynROS8604_01953 [Synechococcus sp. ROS8604]